MFIVCFIFYCTFNLLCATEISFFFFNTEWGLGRAYVKPVSRSKDYVQPRMKSGSVMCLYTPVSLNVPEMEGLYATGGILSWGCTFGEVYTPCTYSHARWSYRRQFRSLLLCPLSVKRYYFSLFVVSFCLVKTGRSYRLCLGVCILVGLCLYNLLGPACLLWQGVCKGHFRLGNWVSGTG